jgi:hypothetical protein
VSPDTSVGAGGKPTPLRRLRIDRQQGYAAMRRPGVLLVVGVTRGGLLRKRWTVIGAVVHRLKAHPPDGDVPITVEVADWVDAADGAWACR